MGYSEGNSVTQSARWLASDPKSLPEWTYQLTEQIVKAVQDNAVKYNPDKIFIAIVLEVVLRMTTRLVVGTLCRIIRQGLIIIISLRHIRGIVALAGHLVVTVQIAFRVGLVSIAAN